MAINQSQVDHIISTASADDPEVKLQNLQDEVDLLKKSVKKLLIDLRERLNETENPFIVSALLPQTGLPPAQKKETEIKPENEDIKEDEDIDAESKLNATDTLIEENKQESMMLPAGNITDKNALQLLKKQIEDIENSAGEIPADTKPKDRPKLKKLHRLFELVSRMVKKYGHDRLLIMIESYRTMGYISEDACSQVEEISKLMPEYIGDLHEISSEEFVAELYVLNRILSPDDSSLDREMIEVMMDKKDLNEKESSVKEREETSEEDWIDMLEKV
jgi:hypothetical protein